MKIDGKSCAKVGITVFLLYLAITYWTGAAQLLKAVCTAASPLLIGCVMAYIVNILMSFYERYFFPKTKNAGLIRSRRPVCMVAAFATVVLVVILLVNMVVPELISCVQLLAAQTPRMVETVVGWLDKVEIVPEDILASLRSIDWKSKVEQIIGALTTGVSSLMGTAISVVATVFSSVVNGLFALIFAIYLLLGKEKLASQFDKLMKRFLKTRSYQGIKYVLSVLNDCFHKYIVGQCTEAVILGSLCTLGMWILRLPYATMTGAVIAFTALIPVAGAYIGAAVGAFMILTVSPMQAVIFLVYILVLQQLEGNLIYPKVVGSSMGLPAIWVLAAVTIGGGVMGIVGMLLGVPVAATVYRLLSREVNKPAPEVPDRAE